MGRNSKDDSLTRYENMLKISVRYNDYLRYPRLRLLFSSKNRKINNVASSYVRHVKLTLARLNKEDRNLIINEFFASKSNSLWWTKYYSRSTYYRKRGFAIKAFFEVYSQ